MAVEFAQMQAQLQAIGDSVEEIKSTVAKIVVLDRSMAEILIKNGHTEKDVEALKTWKERSSTENMTAMQGHLEQINKVNGKIEEVRTQGRTTIFIGGLVFIIVQACVTAAVSWTFGHVSSADTTIKVQQYRIEQLETKVKDGK
jgi:hypothetical protein